MKLCVIVIKFFFSCLFCLRSPDSNQSITTLILSIFNKRWTNMLIRLELSQLPFIKLNHFRMESINKISALSCWFTFYSANIKLIHFVSIDLINKVLKHVNIFILFNKQYKWNENLATEEKEEKKKSNKRSIWMKNSYCKATFRASLYMCRMLKIINLSLYWMWNLNTSTQKSRWRRKKQRKKSTTTTKITIKPILITAWPFYKGWSFPFHHFSSMN